MKIQMVIYSFICKKHVKILILKKENNELIQEFIKYLNLLNIKY